MSNPVFSKGDAIRFGWDTMTKHVGFFIALFIVYGIVYFVPHAAAEAAMKNDRVLGLFLHGIDMALTLLMSIGLVKISLDFCRGEKGSLLDLFAHYRLLGTYLPGAILYALIVVGGFFLLIVPGLVWSVKFWFFDYAIVDEEAGPVESLKTSATITQGLKWELFVFFLLLFLINLAGALVCFVGLFATLPTTMIAAAYVYCKLRDHEKPVPAASASLPGALPNGPHPPHLPGRDGPQSFAQGGYRA